ncbi:MAG: RAD55 family ATPase, partial [Bacteriovoracaceae bacterium]
MELISTGSDNLDLILNGGLPRRGSYLLRGAPGTGKTVLSNQMAFNHAKNGEKVLYLSGLAENNDTYIYHLSSFSFFQAEDLNKNIFYYSILTLIEESSKVDEMVDRLIEQIQKIDASLLIIDSLQSFDPFFSKKEDIRILINKLKAASTVIDLTMIVMQTTGSQEYHKEASDLDGIIELSLEAFEQKRVRMVE